ncbi:hypothetical protein ONZ43_g35 [Nemania bipapillata]|uniref:Uncharacterized protein n=1 Tax=Nemania bipapillata TaxID=110536 RepID=A0ACC2J9W9_9PEZI|nr:hypothetical protein ONZ43_g35 [Nemania bipapillata]
MAKSNEAIIAAVHEFYSAIIRLPYIDTDALVLPPSDGWSDVNADELRKRGKTEKVIELLRHLPYLRNPDKNRKWMLSPDTLAIAYCDGEAYSSSMDELQPTPAHCIWLTAHDSRDGIDLLLDTQTGSITEWSMLGKGLMIDYAEYEGMDKADQWMCFPTMPVVEFFKLWQARWEKLVWIPVYNPKGGPATASWWYRAIPGSDEEEYILDSDAEYEPTDDEDDDSDSADSGAEDEGDEDDTSGLAYESTSKRTLTDQEVDELLEDAFGKNGEKMRITSTEEEQKAKREAEAAAKSKEQSEDDKAPASDALSPEQEANALYAIFQRLGWPDEFDREKCKAELDEFRQSRKRS